MNYLNFIFSSLISRNLANVCAVISLGVSLDRMTMKALYDDFGLDVTTQVLVHFINLLLKLRLF